MNQTYLGHNTNSEMGLKAQHLVFIFRTNESCGIKVGARRQFKQISTEQNIRSKVSSRFPYGSGIQEAQKATIRDTLKWSPSPKSVWTVPDRSIRKNTGSLPALTAHYKIMTLTHHTIS